MSGDDDDILPTEGTLVDLEEAKKQPRRVRKPPKDAKMVTILLYPGLTLPCWDDGWFVEIVKPVWVKVWEDSLEAIKGEPAE